MKTCIHQGILLSEQYEFQGDVLFENGKITAIGKKLAKYADRVINAKGKYVFAGGVDEHTHFGSFHSCSLATAKSAVIGGTTTIGDYVDQKQGQSLRKALDLQRIHAQKYPYVNIVFHSMLMDTRVEVIEEIANLPMYGVSTIKLFTAYRGTPYYADDHTILKIMECIKGTGLTLMVHAENADMIELKTKKLVEEGNIAPYYHALARDCDTEAESVQRLISYAEWMQIPIFFVHISSAKALRYIEKAKQKGQPVFCETCTHYLTLDDSFLAMQDLCGCRYICSPPLRSKENISALWEGIHKGIVDAVSSDHCAISGGYVQKMKNYQDFSHVANGIPGVQFRLQMLWSEGVCKNKITKQEFVRVFSSRPAEICHLPYKGKLCVDYDADIVIYDPNNTHILCDKDSCEGGGYTPYAGLKVKGCVEQVYLHGELTVMNGIYCGKGRGKVLTSSPYGGCYK